MRKYWNEREKLYTKKIKCKKQCIIPAKLNNYINDNTINVTIDIKITHSDIFIKNNKINIDIDTYRIIDDFGYDFYLKELVINKYSYLCIFDLLITFFKEI